MISKEKRNKYVQLNIDFSISDSLQHAIDVFLHHINYESGTSEDCLRSEIDFYLKENKPTLSQEQYELLKDYYVNGAIYSTGGLKICKN